MRKINLLLLSSCFALPTLAMTDGISGYIDGSYNYLAQSNKFTSGLFNRVFDLTTNGLTLQQAAIIANYQPPQNLGGLFHGIIGRDANVTASYGINPTATFDSQMLALDFPQAFLQYAYGSTTLYGGRFLTLIGVEGVDPTENVNFSQSILSYTQPGTHTGIRGKYIANNALIFNVGINNGWDNIRDWGRRKTIELGIHEKVNHWFSFYAAGTNGEERATPRTSSGPTGIETLLDLVATFNATKKITLVANYNYGWQTTATLPGRRLGRAMWTGITGYVNYKYNDRWRTSLRAEVFDDRNGFQTGVAQNWREITLTLGYAPIKNLEFRAETRRDFSNVNSFVTKNGGVNNYQQSYALDSIYKFA